MIRENVTNTKDLFSFRSKVFYTGCLYAIFFSMGWGRGQLGPSFADLQLICNVDLETGSWLVTAFYIGYIFGSLIGGVLYDKMDRKLTFVIMHVVVACTYFVIPWCSVFGLMLVMFTTQGVAEGAVDTIANTEIIKLWKKHGKSIYFAVTCIFCIGGMVSPLVTSPFLLEVPDLMMTPTTNVYLNGSNTTTVNTAPYQLTVTSGKTNLTYSDNIQNTKSRLHFAFSISGCLFLLVAISNFISYVCERSKEASTVRKENHQISVVQTQPLFTRLKLSSLCIISFLLCILVGTDEVYFSYLSIFSVQQLSWTKIDGARLTSLAFFSSLASGFFAVFLVKCLNTQLYMGICLFLAFFSFCGIAVSAYFYIGIGIWICVSLHSIAKANTFTLTFSWTNEFITPVTGKISSGFMVASMISSSLNPLLIGRFMEDLSPIWFSYLIVIEYVLSIIAFIVIMLLTRCIIKRYGTVIERSNKCTCEVSVTTKELLPIESDYCKHDSQ